MPRTVWNLGLAAFLSLGIGGVASAKLPALTPEQQQAAAAKKEQAAAKQAQEKQQLTETMDRVAERWRGRAAKEGWKTHPATPVAAQSGAPAQGTQPASGAQPAAGQPTMPPIRSEKAGTAPPSEDVKTKQPSGARLDERIYKNPVEEPPHKKPAR